MKLFNGALSIRLILTVVLALVLSTAAYADAFSVAITVDENCNGSLTNSFGFAAALSCSFAPDPGPGGLASVMTYGLLSPPGLVAGDVLLVDPGGFVGDVLRFNGTGATGSLVFYSDNLDGFDSLADTTGPPGAFYANVIRIPEIGTEADNRAIYTPVAGQPGFVAGADGPVTYTFISDGTGPSPVPEPTSILLMASGLAAIAGSAFRKLRK